MNARQRQHGCRTIGSKELTTALAVVPQAILIADIDRRVIFCNREFSRLTGYDISEIIGRTCSFIQGAETNKDTVEEIRLSLEKNGTYSGEILNYKKSGELFWNDLFIAPIFNAAGLVANYVGVLRDITKRKKEEENETKLQRLYTFLFNHVQAGIILHKANTEIIYLNLTASKLLGVSSDDIIGAINTDSRLSLIHEAGGPLPIHEYPVNMAINSRAVIENMVYGIRRINDNELKWLLCSAFPNLDRHNNVIDVLVTFTDVTDLKTAEDAFKKSEERLNLVLRGANDGGWDFNLLTDETYYAPRWWEMLGLPVNSQTADSELWKHFVHIDDRAHAIGLFEKSIADEVDSYQIEFRLKHMEGHFVPVLFRGYISRDGEGRATRVSGTYTDLTDQKAAAEKIYQLAFYDPLTDLPNRRLLTELLRKAIVSCKRTLQVGALLFIDLDNFKALNDTLGHDVGDQFLQQVAKRLVDCVRGCDNVARLGGDEFLVVLENLNENREEAASNVKKRAEAIRDALNDVYLVQNVNYLSTASIGIALFDAGDTSAEIILKQADLAMYKAKADGRDSLRFFDHAMQVAADEHLRLERDLRLAVNTNQIILYFQPQVSQLGEIVGAEVLARWFHQEHGFISPATFIPLAESCGIIHKMGENIMYSACQQLAIWESDTLFTNLRISVNVSVRQFLQPEFVDSVLTVLVQTGARPEKLRLEVTESLFAGEIENIIAKMNALRKHGITFSLDDFGTGYSSLHYLQKMPLDELKIDRSFVTDLGESENAAKIVKIIIALATAMDIEIVAEGVETLIQRDFLVQQNCKLFQGYLFSPPQNIAAFELFVSNENLSKGAVQIGFELI